MTTCAENCAFPMIHFGWVVVVHGFVKKTNKKNPELKRFFVFLFFVLKEDKNSLLFWTGAGTVPGTK